MSLWSPRRRQMIGGMATRPNCRATLAPAGALVLPHGNQWTPGEPRNGPSFAAAIPGPSTQGDALEKLSDEPIQLYTRSPFPYTHLPDGRSLHRSSGLNSSLANRGPPASTTHSADLPTGEDSSSVMMGAFFLRSTTRKVHVDRRGHRLRGTSIS